MPPPLKPGKRCGPCRRQKKICSFTTGQDICDLCLERGSTCRPPPRSVPRTRNIFKCDYCRTAHETCYPIGRTWPDKCEYCTARDLPCSKPSTKKDFDGSRSLRGPTATVFAERNRRSNRKPHDTSGSGPSTSVLMPVLSKSEISGSEESESEALTSATVPIYDKPKVSEGVGYSAAEEVKKLKTTLQTMEEEFRDILKSAEERHKAEIKALKDKYQKELMQQRDKYESRIDDLIKIMKNMG